MSKKTAKNNNKQHTSPKKNIMPIICVVIVIAAAASVLLPKLAKSDKSGNTQPAVTSAGGNVEISADSLSSTASYYDYDAGGTTVQLFALKDDDVTLRLALNTCQVCNGSPYAYFVQEGDSFICQNCMNSFDSSRIGVKAGGCNPVPITDDDYTVQDGYISVSSEFLDENSIRFTNWKKF